MQIGIDQSFTSTGLVISQDNKLLHYQVILSNSTYSNFHRAIDITKQIHFICKDYQPDIVNIEGLAFGMKGNATRDLAGLQYCVITQLIKDNIPYNIIPPTTLKKFATGNGKANKQQMYSFLPLDVKESFQGIKKTYGLYDLTDAYWLSIFHKN